MVSAKTTVVAKRITCSQCGATKVVEGVLGRRTPDGWVCSSRTGGWACRDCRAIACLLCASTHLAPTDDERRAGRTSFGWRKRSRGGKAGWVCPPCGQQPGLPRGFATLSPERRRVIASKGGKAAQALGVAHNWTPEEARRAGRVGGQVSRGGRGKLPPSAAV